MMTEEQSPVLSPLQPLAGLGGAGSPLGTEGGYVCEGDVCEIPAAALTASVAPAADAP